MILMVQQSDSVLSCCHFIRTLDQQGYASSGNWKSLGTKMGQTVILLLQQKIFSIAIVIIHTGGNYKGLEAEEE